MSDSALKQKEWIGPLLKSIALASSVAASTLITKKYMDSINAKELNLQQLTQRILNEKVNIQQQQQQASPTESIASLTAIPIKEGDLPQSPKNLSKLNSNPPNLVLSKGQSTFEQSSQIYKICITGGPCAGKTSGLVMLSEKLRDEGFNVFTVPESATMIANGGGQIDTRIYKETEQKNFQKAILKSQAQLEDSFIGIAKLQQGKSVVLCDRGIMDGSAYLSPQLWNELLGQMGLTEVQLRDKRYDCVIHLVTAADGAEQFYNKNNDVRYESPQEAIVVDRKLQLAWLGHPNYEIIDNISSVNFEQKLEKLTNKVRVAVGLPGGNVAKRQRRYLLESLKFFDDSASKNKEMDEPIKIQRFYIEDSFIQSHLPVEGDHHKIFTKVRRRGQSSQYVYTWSQSQYKNDVQIATQKKQLNSKEYLFMLSLQDPTRMSLLKERICFMMNNIFYVIDTFFNVQEGFSILKVRLQEENQEPVIPDFLKIARDVTNEKGYMSKVLAKKNWYAPQGDETILNFRKDSM